MSTLHSLPTPPKDEEKGWVVGLITGERVFIKSEKFFQDDTSLVFHNNSTPIYNENLVMQIEKIHVVWFMPNNEELSVLISTAPTEEEEESDESED